uniref:Uncharacterized protein n=1 Tax=Rhizochromulina marina TaxID=1034831 RepID=A0A7S2RQH5_9STRA|mmetsp:Transcript_19563/g.57079  ORF Transcript_19563/g.57079 Transcript_19563/m.57079 type:complete len:322 (+) Transcript_19563:137-1102(+)
MASQQSRPIDIQVRRDIRNPRSLGVAVHHGYAHDATTFGDPPPSPVIGSMPAPSFLKGEMPHLSLPPTRANSEAPGRDVMQHHTSNGASLPADFRMLRLSFRKGAENYPAANIAEGKENSLDTLRGRPPRPRRPTLERVPSSSLLGYSEQADAALAEGERSGLSSALVGEAEGHGTVPEHEQFQEPQEGGAGGEEEEEDGPSHRGNFFDEESPVESSPALSAAASFSSGAGCGSITALSVLNSALPGSLTARAPIDSGSSNKGTRHVAEDAGRLDPTVGPRPAAQASSGLSAVLGSGTETPAAEGHGSPDPGDEPFEMEGI